MLIATATLREALVRIRHRTRSGKVAGLQLSDLKSCSLDEFINLSIEVASPSGTLPKGREPVLPSGHTGVWSAAMFEKD